MFMPPPCRRYRLGFKIGQLCSLQCACWLINCTARCHSYLRIDASKLVCPVGANLTVRNVHFSTSSNRLVVIYIPYARDLESHLNASFTRLIMFCGRRTVKSARLGTCLRFQKNAREHVVSPGLSVQHPSPFSLMKVSGR